MAIVSADPPPELTPLTDPRSIPGDGVLDLDTTVRGILGRRPAVGLALGVIRDGRLSFFRGHGLADIAMRTPITEDTIFRIGSITKLLTSIAVMQLVERGLVDLDAPASDYLRAYELVRAEPGFRPTTLRHLLTHTSGIPEVRGITDLLRGAFTPSGGRPATLSVRVGEPMPSLAEYYRDGLRVVVEPGTAFAYCNHGFATLGQIIEDVSGVPLQRYLREHLFEPLGMTGSELRRSRRVLPRLATGYVLRGDGPRAVPDREWIDAGAGGVYATTRDIARFAAALLAGGGNDYGRVLDPRTLATMFEPHFQPDPRIPGMGLGFFRHDVGGHHVVGHDGILPGFNSALLVAPDDGLGVVAFTNGSSGAFAWLQLELLQVLRELLGVPGGAGRRDVPHHPEVWPDLCGRYVFPPRISDLRARLMIPGGVEVFVRGGRLMVRLLAPVPALSSGFPLEPDDDDDASAFRVDLTAFGMSRVQIVFGRVAGGRASVLHADLGGQPISLVRADPMPRRGLALGATALVAAAAAAGRYRGRGSRHVD
jgi:CubicO group peptidase (beta-lactamase class C family)